MKYRVPIGGQRLLSTYERALSRARRFYKLTGHPIDVYEVDDNGNETPIAHIPKKKVKDGTQDRA